MTQVPLPQGGDYVEAVRGSCHSLRIASNIEIDEAAARKLLLSPAFLDTFERLSTSTGLAFPLQFSSAASELNFLSVLSLLNFASGYRVPLHEQTGRGAWDNIRALVFSLYISSTIGEEADFLTARGMQTIDSGVVAEQLRVSIHVDRPHESIPGVTVSEVGGSMNKLVQSIVHTLNETGDVLVKSGYPDLGTFVLEALKNGEKAAKGGPPDVNVILEQIVKAIPGFQDVAVVNGSPVYCFKKALFLLFAIETRFGASSTNAHSIPIPRTASLPVYSDNVLPSMLVHLGVLNLSAAPGSLSTVFRLKDLDKLLESTQIKSDVIARLPKPPKAGPTVTVEESYILRAAAIDACERMVVIARDLDDDAFSSAKISEELANHVRNVSTRELDLWLWGVAKDRLDYRELERFSLMDTIMF